MELNSTPISDTPIGHNHVFETWLKQILSANTRELGRALEPEWFFADDFRVECTCVHTDDIRCGMAKRAELLADGKEVTLVIRVPHSLFWPQKGLLLPPASSIRIELYPSKTRYLFATKTDTEKFDFEIRNAKLTVDAIMLKDAVMQKLLKRHKNGPFLYPLHDTVRLKTFEMSAGQNSFTFSDLIVNEQLKPTALCYGFIESERFQGLTSSVLCFEDPSGFQHGSVSFDSQLMGGRSTQFHKSNPLWNYYNFLKELNLMEKDCVIDYELYKNGCNLHCHSFRNFKNSDLVPVKGTGKLELDLRFSENLLLNYTCCLFLIFDYQLQLFDDKTVQIM